LGNNQFALGSYLIFLEELICYNYQIGLSEKDGNVKVMVVNINSDQKYSNSHSDLNSIVCLCRKIALSIYGITGFVEGLNLQLNQMCNMKEFSFYPRINELTKYNYDSMERIKQFYFNNGYIPKLKIKNSAIYIRKKNMPILPKNIVKVAVHLKQTSSNADLSNSNIESWKRFFNESKKFNVMFFLIGKEKTNKIFGNYKNIIVNDLDNYDLLNDLTLIETCDLFVGMMSGPANMAIFGKKPYLIFKNPNHHKEEMLVEIGLENKYTFADENQKVLRLTDTFDNIMNEFENVFLTFINYKMRQYD
jgi:ADP-heptose:LPS heptosyltransferase